MIFANGEPKVHVKEEYLIYDGVAMISAIGGTLGLCIGFSFYDLGAKLVVWLHLGTNSKGLKVTSTESELKEDMKEIERILKDRMGALEFKMENLKHILES